MGDFTGSNFEGAHHLLTRTKRPNLDQQSHATKIVPTVKNDNKYKDSLNKKLATPAVMDIDCI
jgi:hypothetical protein